MQDIVIGIDVSKDRMDVAFLHDGIFTMKEFANQEKGYVALINWLRRKGVSSAPICMEATGSYSERIAEYFYEAGFPVSVVNPLQIKRFGQSQLLRTKTDRADARVIAAFAQKMSPSLWQPASAAMKALRNNVRQLTRLKNLLLQEKNRVQEERDPVVRTSIERVIDFLKQEIKQFESNSESQIKNNSSLLEQRRLLESIPGIGVETAKQIMAHIDMERFEHAKQVSAFVGLNPRQHQSGSSIRGRTRISKMGDCKLRKVFYMPAVVAIKYNPVIAEFYDNLLRRGKPKMVAICAAMRKLLHIAYGVLKSKTPFSLDAARLKILKEKTA